MPHASAVGLNHPTRQAGRSVSRSKQAVQVVATTVVGQLFRRSEREAPETLGPVSAHFGLRVRRQTSPRNDPPKQSSFGLTAYRPRLSSAVDIMRTGLRAGGWPPRAPRSGLTSQLRFAVLSRASNNSRPSGPASMVRARSIGLALGGQNSLPPLFAISSKNGRIAGNKPYATPRLSARLS